MTAADLARLEVAKRAYKATEPSATEVQTGVRRARLSLRRVKSRRNWFGKGLVLVVLAVGSLAYAKPHALGELVENLTQLGGAGAARRGGNAGAAATPVAAPLADALTKSPARSAVLEVAAAPEAAAASRLETPTQIVEAAPAHAEQTTPHVASVAAAARPSQAASRAGVPVRKEPIVAMHKDPAAPEAVSDWGRVAQALARGDETKALAALSELSASDDQRTRDKADLGRAQLFLAHGDSDKGCALARSLTSRRAGGHIERQAQLLLKSCTR